MSSPSSLPRESACIASVVLPHAQSVHPRALRGSDLHAFLCEVATSGRDEALANAPHGWEWLNAAEAIDLSRLPVLDPEAGAPEVAMAWNPATGEARELGRGGKVAHEDLAALVRPGELAGISDYVALTPDAVVVFDWKFGYQTVERADVNWQLGAYAAMASSLFGRERAVVAIARILDNGDVWTDVAMLDEMALDAHRARIRQHMRKVAATQEAYRSSGVIPPQVEGAHCRYCPALPFCPAKVALLLSAFTDGDKPAPLLAKMPEPLNEAAAAALWSKLTLAEKLIEKLKENVKDFARLVGQVKLPNGNVLAEGETTRESINVEYAREKLYERFGQEQVERAIEKSETLTKSALDELLKENSSHGKKAELKRKVMAELGDAGALRSYTIRGVAESKPQAKRLKASNGDKAA